jgi:hypothetical protein
MDSAPDNVQRIELTECPRCAYSLAGLPAAWRCPECGYEYDDRTFVLPGISRGTTGLTRTRKWLWIFLALAASVGPGSVIAMWMLAGRTVTLLLVAAWIAVLLSLLRTGRRERKGIERFLFAASGFGYCADLHAPEPDDTGREDTCLTTWDTVTTVIIESKGPNWHRLRIGSVRDQTGRLRKTLLDVGIRCDAAAVPWLREVLDERIQSAHCARVPRPQA